jgi:hypothetical protein
MQSMEVREAAAAVAAGERPVLEDADALSLIEANHGQAFPVAMHRTGDWSTVFFITKQSDGHWRNDIVGVNPVDVSGPHGGTGGIMRVADVEPGKPFVEGHGQHFLADGMALHQVDGVSADVAVRMRSGDEIVAEATVAAHGNFVLSAILPADAAVAVEAQ